MIILPFLKSHIIKVGIKTFILLEGWFGHTLPCCETLCECADVAHWQWDSRGTHLGIQEQMCPSSPIPSRAPAPPPPSPAMPARTQGSAETQAQGLFSVLQLPEHMLTQTFLYLPSTSLSRAVHQPGTTRPLKARVLHQPQCSPHDFTPPSRSHTRC